MIYKRPGMHSNSCQVNRVASQYSSWTGHLRSHDCSRSCSEMKVLVWQCKCSDWEAHVTLVMGFLAVVVMTSPSGVSTLIWTSSCASGPLSFSICNSHCSLFQKYCIMCELKSKNTQHIGKEDQQSTQPQQKGVTECQNIHYILHTQR